MPVQAEQQKLLEDRLFRHFKGWTWSERARDTSSWLWDFGCDIQRHGARKWACKHCILMNRPSIASFASSGLQNAANHLWREHKIPAPTREKRSTAQLKSEGAPESKQPTITSALKLNINKPREQTIANYIISRFNKQHFQRMLVELIEEIDRATTLKLRSKKPLKLIINNDTRWLSLSDNAVSVGSVRKRSVWVANSVVTLLPARQQFPEVFNYEPGPALEVVNQNQLRCASDFNPNAESEANLTASQVNAFKLARDNWKDSSKEYELQKTNLIKAKGVVISYVDERLGRYLDQDDDLPRWIDSLAVAVNAEQTKAADALVMEYQQIIQSFSCTDSTTFTDWIWKWENFLLKAARRRMLEVTGGRWLFDIARLMAKQNGHFTENCRQAAELFMAKTKAYNQSVEHGVQRLLQIHDLDDHTRLREAALAIQGAIIHTPPSSTDASQEWPELDVEQHSILMKSRADNVKMKLLHLTGKGSNEIAGKAATRDNHCVAKLADNQDMTLAHAGQPFQSSDRNEYQSIID
ncbi:hypothetical protein NHJ6243_009879 [Beauveria neobassiana]